MGDNESTIPSVFIIESLDFEDEKKNLFEGHIISNILALSNIESQYYYVRSKKEFKAVLGLFYDSNYRYLHISCHGGINHNSIFTTLDEIPFKELGTILSTHLYRKRLFLSACSVVNSKFAEAVIPQSDCFSIIGPKNDIEFRDAAIMWSSFYHLMFKNDNNKMVRNNIINNLQKVVNTFDQPLNYFSNSAKKGIAHKLISPI